MWNNFHSVREQFEKSQRIVGSGSEDAGTNVLTRDAYEASVEHTNALRAAEAEAEAEALRQRLNVDAVVLTALLVLFGQAYTDNDSLRRRVNACSAHKLGPDDDVVELVGRAIAGLSPRVKG